MNTGNTPSIPLSTFRLGVLGGIGPEATGIFYLRLIKELQRQKLITRNADFPQIIINSIPAPELIFEAHHEVDIDPYLAGLKELDTLSLDLMVMVCNTIHLFYDNLSKEMRTPLLDLRAEVSTVLRQKKISAIAVLGTPQSLKQQLYHLDEMNIIYPTESERMCLTQAIFDYNRGAKKEKSKTLVEAIVRAKLFQGADLVILGCTELAIMLENTSLPILDTIDVMVEAVITRLKQHRRIT